MDLLLPLGLFLCVQTSLAEIVTVGNVISPGLNFPADGPSTWIDLSTALPTSVVIRWRLFSRLPAKPVNLQIWRPVEGTRYLLVAEHRAVPTSIGLHEYDLPPYERVHVQKGDLLGFSNEQDQGPVSYSHTPQSPSNALKMFYNTTAGAPRVGHVFRFGSYRYSRTYSVNVDIVRCQEVWSVIDLSCAKVMETPTSWSGARDLCQRSGGHLATPKTHAYISALRNQMILLTVPSLWIGVELNDTSDLFAWADGSQEHVYGAPWSPGQPDKSHRCVALSIDGQWKTRDCLERAPFVCQARNTEVTVESQEINEIDEPSNSTCKNETSQCTESYKIHEALRDDLRLLRDVGPKATNSSQIRQITSLLFTLAETNAFKNHSATLDVKDAQIYVETLTAAASTVLDQNRCKCESFWQEDFEIGKPIDAAMSLEDVVHDVTSYMISSNSTEGIETSNEGIKVSVNVFNAPNDTIEVLPQDNDIHVTLSKEFFSKEEKKVGVSTIEYETMHELMDYPELADMNGFHKFTSRVWLNSRVLSVKVFPQVQNTSTNGARASFVFSNLNKLNSTTDEPSCVFWDPAWKSWSSRGCHVTFWNENETRCICDHLTNFAILVQTFDIPMSRIHRHTLTLLTYIGCGLSIIGCLATIIVLLVGRCTSERGLILINLSAALFVAHLVFFFGIEYKLNTRGCVAVAILLHYFYLSSFFWMLAQGIELYLKLRVVFTTRTRTAHYLLLGWGLPAIIVTVSVSMRIEDYGKDEYCWLSFRTGLIWSFIGPVIIIATVNFFVLCVALSTFREHRGNSKDGGPVLHTDTGKSRSRSAARAAVILLPVLGITWLTGLLSVNKYTIIFQYIFAACNSLQGFLIFIFHCVLNDELRSSCYRHFRKPRSESIKNSDGSQGGATRYPGSQPVEQIIPEKQPASATPSVESGIESATSWEVPHGISIASLLPGRSKRISITDPKTRKHCRHPNMEF